MTAKSLQIAVMFYLLILIGYVVSIFLPITSGSIEVTQYLAWYEARASGPMASASSLIALIGLSFSLVASIGLLRLRRNATYLFATGFVLSVASEACISDPVLKSELQVVLDTLASAGAGAILALSFTAPKEIFAR